MKVPLFPAHPEKWILGCSLWTWPRETAYSLWTDPLLHILMHSWRTYFPTKNSQTTMTYTTARINNHWVSLFWTKWGCRTPIVATDTTLGWTCILLQLLPLLGFGGTESRWQRSGAKVKHSWHLFLQNLTYISSNGMCCVLQPSPQDFSTN